MAEKPKTWRPDHLKLASGLEEAHVDREGTSNPQRLGSSQ